MTDTPNTLQIASDSPTSAWRGFLEPRIRSPKNDLPSKGQEMIDFCKEIGFPLLPWQENLAIEMHKVKPDGRWYHNEIGVILSRQNGKSTFMALRILTGMYVWGEKLQVHTAHKLTTSSEIFWKIDDMIQSNPILLAKFGKKYESKGSQEIKLNDGTRYLVRANNSAARGIAAVDVIHMDEAREYKDDEVWSSMRYTQMSSKNPMTIVYSNAGDATSLVLLKLRERGLAASNGADDPIGWFEWSAEPDKPISDPKGLMQANPSLGYTIHPDNLIAALKDEESIVRTEILCQWVSQINPAINPSSWAGIADENAKLDREKPTWLAIDLSPDRRAAALVAAQRLDGDRFVVILLETYTDPNNLDDKQIANSIAEWYRKYQVDTVAYSRQTAGAVASRLVPAGIPITAVDGAEYGQACDEMASSISSGRMVHTNQPELNKQMLSAVKLPYKDGGWYLGRKVSHATICAAVAVAMVSHYATRPDSEVDIVLG
jgi:phage terminase large subunit-like protein